MSNLTEWRWNRDWGMVKLAPHSPVAASEGFYKVTDVRERLAELEGVSTAYDILLAERDALRRQVEDLHQALSGKPEPRIHVISIDSDGLHMMRRIVKIERSDDLDIYIHGD